MIGSLSAYAKHRKSLGLTGGSLMAVQKARDSRRITLEPDGRVDFERADADWAQNSNRRQTRPARETEDPGRKAVDVALTGKAISDESFLEAQRQREWERVARERNSRLKEEGKLVDADETERAWTKIATGFRNSVMGLPAAIANRLPEEWRRQVMAAAEDEARQILTALSNEIRPDQQAA